MTNFVLGLIIAVEIGAGVALLIVAFVLRRERRRPWWRNPNLPRRGGW